MLRQLHRFTRNSVGSVAVETAIFAPVFLLLTLGITDLGTGMFVQMQVNAAAQSGAAYAVINSGSSSACATLSATCLSGIETAMNDATGNTFCTGTVCPASLTSCADANGGICFTVTANYPFTAILPDAVYTWGSPQNYSSTVTVRIR
jgi:Flp pilus assembly protein TadG